MFSNLEQKNDDVEKELCELLDNVDSEAMLSTMIAQLMMQPVEQMADKFGRHPAFIEIIAKHAISRFGKNTGKYVTAFESNHCYGLVERLSNMQLRKYFDSSDSIENFSKINTQLKMFSDIVRGSAYPEQTCQEIIEIQGHFDKWFKTNVGISPSKAVEILFSIVKHMEYIYNTNSNEFLKAGKQCRKEFISLKAKKSINEIEANFLNSFNNANDAGAFGYYNKLNEIIPKVLPINLEDVLTDDVTSQQEAEALKKLIGISKESINEQIEIQRFPLYILSSGKVLLGELSNCLDVLFDTFEAKAKLDDKFYQRYQKHKAKWLEKKARFYLERIFPPDSIYDTLDYPNPDKTGTAELDLAVKWSPFILLIEVKAKQFRFESLRGDVGRLRTDLKENVEDAYIQTIRAINYINSNQKVIFTERNTSRKLELNKDSIYKLYPITLSLHHLAGLANRLDKVCELGLFNNKCFPFSICSSDLDYITKSDITPDIFLHYVEKRLAILHMSQDWQGDELDLFDAYLNNRLNISNFDISNNPQQIDIICTGRSERFEHLAKYERGEIKEKPDISLSIPEPVFDLLQKLRKWDDESARWIAFSLLELEDKLLHELAYIITETVIKKLNPNTFRYCSRSNEDVVVTIVASNSVSLAELKDRTILRAEIEKYRRKLNKGICLGFLINNFSNQLSFETACYVESEWEKNENYEKYLYDIEPDVIAVNFSRKPPKRNELCFCGSGLKYKKCCLNKVEKLQK
jgi:hypothetical protein